ncbi:MAG: branched-chain amino acid ABC transporter permease [Chloroflexota bacterium]|nr:branched-chain amino acid ABC transporter permease [Chloroflexota bacterium]
MRKLRNALPSGVPTLLVALTLFVVVIVAEATGIMSRYWYQVIQVAAITAISALGLNLIYGFNGQFSLGHIGFYAIGAYGSALITKDFLVEWSGAKVGALSWIVAGQIGFVLMLLVSRWLHIGAIRDALIAWMGDDFPTHERWVIINLVSLILVAVAVAVGVVAAWQLQRIIIAILGSVLSPLPKKVGQNLIFLLALLNGGTVAALLAYLVGLPLLRLGSDYFGIATLGLAVMIYTALQNSDMVIATMKGARGMVAIPPLTTWPWVFFALVATIVIIRNLIYSSHGRALISVREDEVAARTMGVNVTQWKVIAFAIGGFFAGVAGGLYAHLYGFLHPSTFNVVKGFDPLIIIVFGGLGSMTGTLVASGLFALILEGLRVVLPQGFEDWRFVIYPILLLLIMLLRQEGLLGTREWGWLQAPSPAERTSDAPQAAEDEEAMQEETR